MSPQSKPNRNHADELNCEAGQVAWDRRRACPTAWFKKTPFTLRKTRNSRNRNPHNQRSSGRFWNYLAARRVMRIKISAALEAETSVFNKVHPWLTSRLSVSCLMANIPAGSKRQGCRPLRQARCLTLRRLPATSVAIDLEGERYRGAS